MEMGRIVKAFFYFFQKKQNHPQCAVFKGFSKTLAMGKDREQVTDFALKKPKRPEPLRSQAP